MPDADGNFVQLNSFDECARGTELGAAMRVVVRRSFSRFQGGVCRPIFLAPRTITPSEYTRGYDPS